MVLFVYEFLSLVIAPLLVGLVLELVSHWLEEKDDN
ncbi:type I toxin-antitoxin system Fst family toxin [Enterococcus faecalis]|nr:type I toxin-antitoxin system Fst family toxin [Enterococcus faecalis]